MRRLVACCLIVHVQAPHPCMHPHQARCVLLRRPWPAAPRCCRVLTSEARRTQPCALLRAWCAGGNCCASEGRPSHQRHAAVATMPGILRCAPAQQCHYLAHAGVLPVRLYVGKGRWLLAVRLALLSCHACPLVQLVNAAAAHGAVRQKNVSGARRAVPCRALCLASSYILHDGWECHCMMHEKELPYYTVALMLHAAHRSSVALSARHCLTCVRRCRRTQPNLCTAGTR